MLAFTSGALTQPKPVEKLAPALPEKPKLEKFGGVIEKVDEVAKILEVKHKVKKAREKEFEKSLVTKKEPKIGGEILESKLLKNIHFDFDKYDIRPHNALILQENTVVLTKHPAVKVQIEGHCDE